jgi:hypothetical protein
MHEREVSVAVVELDGQLLQTVFSVLTA